MLVALLAKNLLTMETIPSKSIYNKRFVLVFLKLEAEGVITSRGDVARELGIDPARLTDMIKGRRHLSVGDLAKFATAYHVNPFYVLFETLPIILTSETVIDMVNSSLSKFIGSSVQPLVQPSVQPMPKKEKSDQLRMVAEDQAGYLKKNMMVKLSDGKLISIEELAALVSKYMPDGK